MLSNRALNTKNTLALASAGHRFKRLLLDALGEERCLLRIVGRGGVSSRSPCHFEWHAPFAQGFEKLRSCAADDMVGQLARCCVDGPYTEFPENFRGRPPGGCQQVRRRKYPAMVLFSDIFYVVLHHQFAANRLDIDRHPSAIVCSSRSSGDVGRRAPLIFSIRQGEKPCWDVNKLDRRVDGGGTTRFGKYFFVHDRSP